MNIIMNTKSARRLFVILSLLTFHFSLFISVAHAQSQFNEKPKLVVGIVVDQMRWDYLDRYYEKFTDGGFRRLIEKGYSCNNCLINYVPTITAIGHTSAYTGSTPAFHGICGNSFYIDGKKVTSCQDDAVQAVGSETKSGNRSPRNMLSTTIGDQLRLHTDFQSKVVGVSYKDRAAIFPAGHSANAAYWLDSTRLCFITSTYYMQELPSYVKRVNNELKHNQEAKKAGDRIGFSPVCGTIITDMAIAALHGEKLGKGKYTDMLCVSYSQTDVIGHEWGTRGSHTDEAYLQLDKDVARLLRALDAQVGSGNYIVFLTADHGAAHNWNYLRDNHISASGPFDFGDINPQLDSILKAELGTTREVIADVLDYRIILNRDFISQQGLDIAKVKQVLVNAFMKIDHVSNVVDYETAAVAPIPERLRSQILMGYHPRRTGNIIIIPEPQYYSWWKGGPATATTHGEWNPYDAHIPCLFMGWHIPHGATSREVHITDIAPTICQLLHIQQPNTCVGEAITEITK